MKDAIDFLDRIEGHGYGGTADYEIARTTVRDGAAEIERLRLENWQLKGALGYPVPSHIPEGDFKCGLCDARRIAAYGQSREQAMQELADQAQALDMGYGSADGQSTNKEG